MFRRARHGAALRRLSVLTGLALCAGALSAGSAHAVYTNNPSVWCAASPGADPCVVSASFDGGAFTSSDPNYAVWAIANTAGGASQVLWSIQPKSASDLTAALGHTFSITIKTSVVPRVIDGFGGSMTYARSGPSGGKYQVTITGQPVSVTDQGGCTYPPAGPTCTPMAPGPSSVIFQGEIDNFNYAIYSDPGYPAGLVDSFNGMDMWTNIAETGLPPTISTVNGQNELQIELADHHFLHDGTTVVHGDFHLRIPETFLSTLWGINDPNTLATDGLSASVGAGGGTLSVTVEPGNTGVQVNITGLTFSRRKLLLKLGHVTPRAPTHIRVSRAGASSAKVTFRPSRPRGQRATGYKLSCKPAGGGSAVIAKSRRSPLAVATLAAGKAYSCSLRGRSRAGYGARSRVFTIPS